MDCLHAQQIISEAADREPVDAELLASARAHCESCPECSRFVRAQIAVANAGLPEPPDDLADRVMVAVRAEAAEATTARQAPATPGGSPAVLSQEALAAMPDTPAGASAPHALPRRLPANAVLIGFAAVVFAGAVGVAVIGTRYMTPAPMQSVSTLTAGESAPVPEVNAAPQASPPSVDKSAQAAVASGTVEATSEFIVVGGRVYRSEGPATVDASTLHDVGAITTSLTSTGTPSQYRVRSGVDTDIVYLVDPAGALTGFRRAKRIFGGQTYYLTSPDLASVAAWPTLPADMSKPTSENGSPTFVAVGADDTGVRVFRLASSPSSGGIAIAPGTGPSDPAAGNPNWTYWNATQ